MKTLYTKLQKLYNLPPLKELEAEFDLSSIQEEVVKSSFPLRLVRRQMIDKVENIGNFLQSLLMPDPNSIINMQESKCLTDNERLELIKIIQEIMVFYRESHILDLEGQEKENAIFILKCYKMWKELKKRVIKILKSLKENWIHEAPETIENYFG